MTFITMMLGVVGAVAGIFGMNFDTPYAHTGTSGFVSVIAALTLFVVVATMIARRRGWM